MAERYGRYPESLARTQVGRRVWIHAVSVGEVVGAMPLLRLVQEQMPGVELVVSTTTKAGRDMLLRTLPSIATFYYPFDFPWSVRRALNTISPDVLAIMETELWPNMLAACRGHGVPALLLNGRVSDRMTSAGRFVRTLYGRAFENLDVLGMQTPRDADRLRALGAPHAKVVILGNMKFDGMMTDLDSKKIDALSTLINPESRRLFVAGSTHPGEEEILLDVFASARKDAPDLLLIIAPRHIERAGEVVSLIQARGLAVARRTQLTGASGPAPDVIILDTIGELRLLYALATACFVGGSLIERGGHNVLEPAACGKAPFYGPHTANFTESIRVLEQGGGGRPVKDADDFTMQLIFCLIDSKAREAVDARALDVVRANTGATARAFELLRKYL
jgi:3-deoxy-D-manno-octulosonic-acid transferase